MTTALHMYSGSPTGPVHVGAPVSVAEIQAYGHSRMDEEVVAYGRDAGEFVVAGLSVGHLVVEVGRQYGGQFHKGRCTVLEIYLAAGEIIHVPHHVFLGEGGG